MPVATTSCCYGPTAVERRRYEQRARVVKALAHASRLIIVDALSRGERCVCELQEIVGSDMSTVSKHLFVMKSAGIVQDRKVGLKVYYRLRVPCITDFFVCAEKVLGAAADELA